MPDTRSLPRIGRHTLPNRVILAPMAGVTDLPFRRLCREQGAGLVVGEMVTANPGLWHTRKSRLRMDHRDEPGPRTVQIAGGDAAMLAEAARRNVAMGAEIIDINMGCPAKKVCNKAAGSALLRDESLVAEILEAVVNAVDVPVTLKIRTGWCAESNNGIRVARLAESAGIQALAVHGRHRQQRFTGNAEYDTIAAIKASVAIPVFANGDIACPEKAAVILDYTGADAVMIGRGAQGNPWIFGEIDHYLRQGEHRAPPSNPERLRVLNQHLAGLHDFYGHHMGVRIARKHLSWYLNTDSRLTGTDRRRLKAEFNGLETPAAQYRFIVELLSQDFIPTASGVVRPVSPDGTRAA